MIYFIIIMVILTIILYKGMYWTDNLKEKCRSEIIKKLNKKIKNMPMGFYFELEGYEVSNISEKKLEIIEEKIDENEYNYENNKIIVKEDMIFLVDQDTEKSVKLERKLSNQEKANKQIRDEIFNNQNELRKRVKRIHDEVENIISNLQYQDKETKKLLKLGNKLRLLDNYIETHGNLNIKRDQFISFQTIREDISKGARNRAQINYIDQNKNDKFYIQILGYDKLISLIKIISTAFRGGNNEIRVQIKEKKLEVNLKSQEQDIITILGDKLDLIKEYDNINCSIHIDKRNIEIEMPINKIRAEDDSQLVSIKIFSKINKIDKVKKEILNEADLKGFDLGAKRDINLALDELLTNAIIHGNKYDEFKRVVIKYGFSKDELKVSIIDQGKGFDYNQVLDGKGNRGIFLVEKVVNSLKFRKNGSEVIFTKKQK
ncbi:MAG: ATP-binding protein [Fusobacteriota bacterium]